MNNEAMLCVRNGFFVKVVPIKNHGCSVEYPKNLFGINKVDPIATTYIANNDGFTIYTNQQEKTIKAKKYLIRPAIFAHILKEARDRYVNNQLILVYHKNKYVKLSEMLNIINLELKMEEKEIESRLLFMVPAIVYGDVSKLEVNEDNEFLCTFLTGGF